MRNSRFIFGSFIFILLVGCTSVDSRKQFVEENIIYACEQTHCMLTSLGETQGRYPRSTKKDGSLSTTDIYGWTSGFFPGTLWMLYELTNDSCWKEKAVEWTLPLEPNKYNTKDHDVGFMMYNSFGRGFALTKDKSYRDILVQTANSLMTRFNPNVHSIKSWEGGKAPHDTIVWQFPVIIDNMMNLELLFWASKATGDPSFRNIAISHAEKTMKYQIRKDGSSYHLACYDPETGNFIKGETSQGYSNESTWSRGQGWGIYGFTLCYRETKDPRFLKTAQRMADYYINHPNLPSDKIPWWDFDTHRPGFIPGKFSKTNKYIQNYRDASAASVTASALLELSSYVKDDKKKIYTETALQILTSLSSPEYRAEEGKNGNFILKHSTGAIPHGSEVDVPLIYADYYFLEALLRYNRMINNKPIL